MESHWWSINIGLGNGLVPSGNKPLPKPKLTEFYDDHVHDKLSTIIFHCYSPFTWTCKFVKHMSFSPDVQVKVKKLKLHYKTMAMKIYPLYSQTICLPLELIYLLSSLYTVLHISRLLTHKFIEKKLLVEITCVRGILSFTVGVLHALVVYMVWCHGDIQLEVSAWEGCNIVWCDIELWPKSFCSQ